MGYRLHLALFGMLFAGLSCRREDDSPPVVMITSPVVEEQASYGELIPVSFVVTDETGIEEVSVVITDYGGRVVVGPKRMSGEGRQRLESSAYLDFDDAQVETGDYILRVLATDGRNESQDLIGIRLTGMPLRVTRRLLLRGGGALSSACDSLDGSGQLAPARALSGQFYRLACNSRDQVVHFTGDQAAGIATFSGVTLEESGTLEVPWGLGSDLFTDTWYDRQLDEVWISSRDGMIRRMGSAGQADQVVASGHPLQTAASGSYLFAWSDPPGGTPRLETLSRLSGQLLQSVPLPGQVLNLLPLPPSSGCLVVRASIGESPFVRFDPSTNTLDEWSPFSLAPSEDVTASCGWSGGVAASFADAIRVYSSSGSLLYASSLSYEAIAVAVEEGETPAVWVLESDRLVRLAWSAGMPETFSVATGGNARDFALLYNK